MEKLREQAKEKRVTIRTNFVELRNLRQELRSKVLEIRSLLNSYRALDNLTDEQIDDAQEKIVELKQAKDIIKEEYNKVNNTIKEYQDDRSDQKLHGLDRVIASQTNRISALNEAMDQFK
jgi:uncharacterized coiled-coil DUF342 family protein